MAKRSCNPCYNGYGAHPKADADAWNNVVILVIMDMVHTV